MKKFSTVELLATAALVMLVATTIAYALPHVPEGYRSLLSGQFIGYSGALLLALKSDGSGGPGNPITP